MDWKVQAYRRSTTSLICQTVCIPRKCLISSSLILVSLESRCLIHTLRWVMVVVISLDHRFWTRLGRVLWSNLGFRFFLPCLLSFQRSRSSYPYRQFLLSDKMRPRASSLPSDFLRCHHIKNLQVPLHSHLLRPLYFLSPQESPHDARR